MSSYSQRRRNERRRAAIIRANYDGRMPSLARRRRWKKRSDAVLREVYSGFAHDGVPGVDIACHAKLCLEDLPPSQWPLTPTAWSREKS